MELDAGQVETGSVGTETPEAGTGAGVAESFIPQEYSENQYFKDINGFEDLNNKFEQMTNDFNQMKGKKGLPEQHTQEEWAKVVDSLPEEARGILGELTAQKVEAPEAYEFADIEGFESSEEDKAMFEGIFKKNNIPQDQANALRADIISSQAELLNNRNAAQDKEFDRIADETWGANKVAKVSELSAKLAKMYEGTGVDADYLDTLIDNKHLMPILIGIDKLTANNAPDSGAMGSTNGSSSGYTNEQAGKIYAETMQKAAEGDIVAIKKLAELDQNENFLAQVNKNYG